MARGTDVTSGIGTSLDFYNCNVLTHLRCNAQGEGKQQESNTEPFRRNWPESRILLAQGRDASVNQSIMKKIEVGVTANNNLHSKTH